MKVRKQSRWRTSNEISESWKKYYSMMMDSLANDVSKYIKDIADKEVNRGKSK